VALYQRFRAHGFLGGNVIRNDGPQDLLAAGIS